MHFLFNKCLVNGAICKDFKKDPKIILPKARKDDNNKVSAYKPITLESVTGKIFQRAVAERLRWKLEVLGGGGSLYTRITAKFGIQWGAELSPYCVIFTPVIQWMKLHVLILILQMTLLV